MRCRERLRVIVFDKIGILSSERALNCTKTLYFDEVSKYACMVRSLACPNRIEFLPCFDRRPSGSAWKIQDSSNIETISLVLLLLPDKLSNR